MSEVKVKITFKRDRDTMSSRMFNFNNNDFIHAF
jgi:hypothetical protein